MSKDLLERLKRCNERVISAIPRDSALLWAKKHHMNTRSQPMHFGREQGADYLYQLYRIIGETPHMVVEKSVQCGLSELFIIQSHIEAGEKGLTVMYVLPKYELRNRFVSNRIYKLHKKAGEYSRMLRKADTRLHRTSLIHFGKGTLAYVGSNVQDEFVEIPVDSAYIDEKDRCNLSNLLMLPDRLTASPYAYQREISNPTVEGFGIDERYSESSQGLWMIRCDHCGSRFTPDFFKHVVQEVGVHLYKPRDPQADSDPQAAGEISLICDRCSKPVDRLKSGEWVHAFGDRKWKGFRISKIFAQLNPSATLRDLYLRWTRAAGNDLKTQIFMNSDLGMPFSGKGSKVTRGMLNACRRRYKWPVEQVGGERTRLMGVDVGEKLHVILRERLKIKDVGWTMRLIGLWVLPDFGRLARLLKLWKPKCCVIDAMPEIHKVSDLKSDFPVLWSSRFQKDLGQISKNRGSREVKIDRTALLDYVKQGFEEQRLTLPIQAESLESGDYYSHLEAPTRVLEANESDPEKSRFAWREGSKPDHFFLAEAYCIQAGMVAPEHGIFEFFEQEYKTTYRDVSVVPSEDLSYEVRGDLARASELTPESVVQSIRGSYHKESPSPSRKVDPVLIKDTIRDMNLRNGYVDLPLAAAMTKTNPGDVLKILRDEGFRESRLKGQYIKGS